MAPFQTLQQPKGFLGSTQPLQRSAQVAYKGGRRALQCQAIAEVERQAPIDQAPIVTIPDSRVSTTYLLVLYCTVLVHSVKV